MSLGLGVALVGQQRADIQMSNLMLAQTSGLQCLGQQSAYDQMAGLNPISVPVLTTVQIMRLEVKDWLKDWDK